LFLSCALFGGGLSAYIIIGVKRTWKKEELKDSLSGLAAVVILVFPLFILLPLLCLPSLNFRPAEEIVKQNKVYIQLNKFKRSKIYVEDKMEEISNYDKEKKELVVLIKVSIKEYNNLIRLVKRMNSREGAEQIDIPQLANLDTELDW
jgi:uncharacterized membrane protein YhiD involved in acid resistance